MTAKRMVSLRLPDPVLAAVDRQAAAAGVTRTEWVSTAIARAALVGSGRPQGCPQGVDDGTP